MILRNQILKRKYIAWVKISEKELEVRKISKLRATVICENSVKGSCGLIGEHGWSLYIEADDTNLLFDTGQGQGILTNSVILQKDLTELRAIILSHGHYDHTSGLPAVLNVIGPRPVFCHPDVFSNRYWRQGDSSREIGIRHRREYLESLGAEFTYVTHFEEIFPGIYLTGQIPRIMEFEPPDPHMQCKDPDGTWRQDPINDDLSMVIDTGKGLVVILGCAHAGLINTLKHIKANLPDRPIHTVLGGTHLASAGPDRLNVTLKALEEFDIKQLGASHCTGLLNEARLFNALQDRYFFPSVGVSLEI